MILLETAITTLAVAGLALGIATLIAVAITKPREDEPLVDSRQDWEIQ